MCKGFAIDLGTSSKKYIKNAAACLSLQENKENARRAPSEQMQDTFMFTS